MTGIEDLELPDSDDLPFDPAAVEIEDGDVFSCSNPRSGSGGSRSSASSFPRTAVFHAATAGAIPKIHEGQNTLICAPTGSGKTLASFNSIINNLYRRDRANEDGLENSVYCLYVSPLKSLANDIHRNLEIPLEGIESIVANRDDDAQMGEIRHAIRHGDTPRASARRCSRRRLTS